MSHDPSEIVLMCKFVAGETFFIIIISKNVENGCAFFWWIDSSNFWILYANTFFDKLYELKLMYYEKKHELTLNNIIFINEH